MRGTSPAHQHPDFGLTRYFWCGHATQGKCVESKPLYKRSLAILEKALGPKHPDVATSLENYASLLRKTGRGNEALAMETRAGLIRAQHRAQNPAK